MDLPARNRIIRGDFMLESILAVLGTAVLMLRISPSGSFPPPLTESEERKCIDNWLNGDIEARNILVEHNLRLVAHIIKKYYTQAEDVDDLISIGTIGLIKGINTYRPDKGVRLATYASRCCENEILMYFRSIKKSSGNLSLSEAIDGDGDGSNLSLMDMISDGEELSEKIIDSELCSSLKTIVDTKLDKREAQIIRLRYGLTDNIPKTQRETAQICKISRSYVSRIEKKALEKLKKALGEETVI